MSFQHIIHPESSEVMEMVKARSEVCEDYPFNYQNISVAEEAKDNQFAVSSDSFTGTVTLTNHALSQLLGRVKIPTHYFGRCSQNLKRSSFNEHNEKQKKNYFFRFEKDKVRAVLSEGYSVVDDDRVFPLILDILDKEENVSYFKFQRDEWITRLTVRFTDIQGGIGDNSYTAGISIVNSEIGMSSLWIEPVVYVNGNPIANRSILRGQQVDCRIVHRGDIKDERIQQMVRANKEIAQVGIIQVAEAATEDVSVDHAVRFVHGLDSLPKRLQHLLEKDWRREKRIAKAQVAKDLINLANQLPLFQRVQAEQHAGKFIGLFNSYKTRMAHIMKAKANRGEMS